MNDKSYEKWEVMPDKYLMEAIGKFVQTHRLNQNKTQERLAKDAGISRSTLSLLERGEVIRLDTLIRVLRVLDQLHIMDVFKIQEQISPIEYAKMRKKQRKQASPMKNNNKDSKDNQDLGW